MAIYRGPGGPGDAVADAASEAALISALVTQAQTAETNAGNSASAASVSATNASNSASTAATAASNAATSAVNASTSASAAATSETNAASSASAASSSASSAATSATNASNSASAASTSASNAASSASSASTSATNAAASYDSFDDRYLGSKSSAPTLDNDGNALLTGALYWNSSNNTMYVWNGTAWTALSSSGTVTSVAMSVPTGLSVSGSPITSSGTLAVTYASGYAIPTTTKQSNWDDSYTFVSAFPTQTGNSGKYLTTNGSTLSWATVTLTETDPIVGAINGIVKANGSGTISVAVAGTDYLAPAAIGVTVQAYDAGLQSIAGLTTAANKMIYTTALDTYAVADLTAAGRALLDDADAATQRTTLGLVIGTNVQAYDAGLQSIAGLTTAADRMIYTTASDTYAVTTLTAAGRAILDDADAATQRTTLGATTVGSNLFTLTNPGAIRFPRFNADNSVSSLSDSDFRTAIGAGTGNGTVTSVGGTGTVNGITLTGTVTSSGSLTLGGTLSGVNLTTQVTGTLPVANGGSGATTLTGIIKGNGTSAFSAATAGTDFVAPGTATTFTAQQTFKELKDTVHTITDGAAFEIDPANGSIQIVTLGANRTPAATNFEAGQVVLLGIDDGSAYTITWTTVNPTWVKAGGTASAPTLATTGYTWILLWEVGTTIYATEVGKP
jgi:hypothetical protein